MIRTYFSIQDHSDPTFPKPRGSRSYPPERISWALERRVSPRHGLVQYRVANPAPCVNSGVYWVAHPGCQCRHQALLGCVHAAPGETPTTTTAAAAAAAAQLHYNRQAEPPPPPPSTGGTWGLRCVCVLGGGGRAADEEECWHINLLLLAAVKTAGCEVTAAAAMVHKAGRQIGVRRKAAALAAPLAVRPAALPQEQ